MQAGFWRRGTISACVELEERHNFRQTAVLMRLAGQRKRRTFRMGQVQSDTIVYLQNLMFKQQNPAFESFMVV